MVDSQEYFYVTQVPDVSKIVAKLGFLVWAKTSRSIKGTWSKLRSLIHASWELLFQFFFPTIDMGSIRSDLGECNLQMYLLLPLLFGGKDTEGTRDIRREENWCLRKNWLLFLNIKILWVIFHFFPQFCKFHQGKTQRYQPFW